MVLRNPAFSFQEQVPKHMAASHFGKLAGSPTCSRYQDSFTTSELSELMSFLHEKNGGKAYVPLAKNKVAFDEEHLQDDGLSMDGQDAIDTSDQIPDFKSTSSKDGHENEELPSHKDNRNTLEDSLAQMKAVYANLISDASWSTFAMDITKPVPSTSVTTQTASSTPTITDITIESSHSNQKSSTASSINGIPGSNSECRSATPVSSSESSLFSTVQLYRQNNKLYGSVFTGASKFRCKDCSAAYDTLVGLTVHMNETGHYRDDNKDKEEDNSKRWSKPRKRSLMEMEGKEDAQKTKHYQKVPLKEPVPALATKLVPSTKKRPVQDPLMCPCSPESLTGSTGVVSVAEQLTAHMMGKQLVFDAVVEEKIQSIPLPPTTTRLPVPSLKSQSVSPPLSGSEIKKETEEKKTEIHELVGGKIKEEKEEAKEKEAKENSTTYKYLREEDLEETPKGGMDILKSLENTVSSAISKAQTVQSVPVQPAINSGIRTVVSDPASIIHSPCSPSSPPTLRNNVSAMEELVEKVTGKASVKKEKEEQMDGAERRRISNNMMEKSAYHSAYDKQNEPLNTYFYEDNNQPIDLRKFKNLNSDSTNSDTNSITSSHPVMNIINGARPLHSSLPLSDSVLCLRENALMDISDMVKNLTGHLTPKSSTPSSISEKSDADSSAFEDALDDFSSAQKRKGRQSNWNPQHLLILQAQFASSLRQTPEGRYAMTDLGPQERVHICKFTGLSMTTVSHWLANVKYQLRRTGGTKFLKNMDSSQPVFLCGDCASQFRTPSSYISHLESHLGFSLKDLSKLSVHQLQEQQAASKKITDKIPCSSPLLSLTSLDEDSNPGYIYQCRLCNRTFVSKHAIKLHLSKTHGKTPEDYLVFVTPLEKLEKEE
ncbi:hypothetical protein P4O66_014159, partial [Electrophorus voltai]